MGASSCGFNSHHPHNTTGVSRACERVIPLIAQQFLRGDSLPRHKKEAKPQGLAFWSLKKLDKFNIVQKINKEVIYAWIKGSCY